MDWSSLKQTALHRFCGSEEGVHHGPMSACGINFTLTLVYAKYRWTDPPRWTFTTRQNPSNLAKLL